MGWRTRAVDVGDRTAARPRAIQNMMKSTRRKKPVWLLWAMGVWGYVGYPLGKEGLDRQLKSNSESFFFARSC